MRSRVSYRFQIDSSYTSMWTGENDAKTLRVDANFFENRKKMRFETNTDTCGQGLDLKKSFIGVPSRCIKLAYPFIRTC